GLADVVEVAAGDHALALGSDGVVHVWGSNVFGALGTGDQVDVLTPTTVVGLTGVTEIDTGGSHSLAVLGGRTARAWGCNASGRLGDGTRTDRLTPVMVGV